MNQTKPSSEWNRYTTGNVIGDYYGELAKKFKDVFVEFVKRDKFIDRAAFVKSGCQRINDGR